MKCFTESGQKRPQPEKIGLKRDVAALEKTNRTLSIWRENKWEVGIASVVDAFVDIPAAVVDAAELECYRRCCEDDSGQHRGNKSCQEIS